MYRIFFHNMQNCFLILSYEPLFICYYSICSGNVNPLFQSLPLCAFTKEDYTIYGFDSVIPVAIRDGRCQINFSKLYDQIPFIYERGIRLIRPP